MFDLIHTRCEEIHLEGMWNVFWAEDTKTGLDDGSVGKNTHCSSTKTRVLIPRAHVRDPLWPCRMLEPWSCGTDRRTTELLANSKFSERPCLRMIIWQGALHLLSTSRNTHGYVYCKDVHIHRPNIHVLYTHSCIPHSHRDTDAYHM